MSYIICFLCSQVINQKEPQTVRVHSFEGKMYPVIFVSGLQEEADLEFLM